MTEAKNIIEHKVYNIIKVKKKYGFRVLLRFDDGTEEIRQFSGFATKKDANSEREKTIAQLVTKTFIVPKKQSVSNFLAEWLETDIKVRTTANTYSTYKKTIKNYILPILGKMYITDLMRVHIKNMYIAIAEKSHTMAQVVKNIMNISMQYAVNKGFIFDNTAKGVPLPKNVAQNLYHTRTIKESSTLNLEQIIILINASRGTGIYIQVLFAVLMGLRRGEINGLKYSDVDFVRQKLHVSRQLGRAANSEDIAFAPKTRTKQEIKLKTQSSNRILDIPDLVFEEILKSREQYERNRSRRSKLFQDLDYICCSSYGRPRSMQYHFESFKEILKKSGLPNIRWHDLRHSYATLLMKNDFNLKAISKILGHAKEIVTADIYVDNQEIIADGVSELSEYMNEVIPEKSVDFNEKENVFDYSYIDVTAAFDSLTA